MTYYFTDQRVRHTVFGHGVIIAATPTTATIQFDTGRIVMFVIGGEAIKKLRVYPELP